MSKHERGVLDTSLIIGITSVKATQLPTQTSIATITLAELAAGTLAASDPKARGERLERLQWAQATFEAIPFDTAAAHAYARIYSAAITSGRKPRGGRALDLLIAATAISRSLPLYTLNPVDFKGVAKLMEIVAL